ncbi:hypothetical protein DBZ36_04645 [Alginatibacterium sediminis]|uniref:Uncharacterized protein n=1 Tax=Alginatibacterium sediminis TaxID=2164068 RepID=A0A420EGB3_9ALTE|nr:hypothetical protein [Alginatibacterium sediminis]RKF19751.1 hypothetical protein DBZ36_04645 [Alginatibacterium sediminis]
MQIAFEPYLLIALTIAILSLWKTYSGPMIAATLSYSYIEMLTFTVIPALFAAYIAWRLAPIYSELFRSKTKPAFKPRLKRFVKMWNTYGQVAMAILAPIIVGIPSYTFIAKQLNQNAVKTFSLLLASIIFWSSLAYFSLAFFNLEQYFAIEALLPQSLR